MGSFSYGSTASLVFSGFIPLNLLQISIEVVSRHRSRYIEKRLQPVGSPISDPPVPIPIPLPPPPPPSYILQVVEISGSSVPHYPTITAPDFKVYSRQAQLAPGIPLLTSTAAIVLCAASYIRWKKTRGAQDGPPASRSGSQRPTRSSSFAPPPRNQPFPPSHSSISRSNPSHRQPSGGNDEDEDEEDAFTDEDYSDDGEDLHGEVDDGYVSGFDDGLTLGGEEPPPPPPHSTTLKVPDPDPVPSRSMWWLALLLLFSILFFLAYSVRTLPATEVKFSIQGTLQTKNTLNSTLQEFVENFTHVIPLELGVDIIQDNLYVEKPATKDDRGVSSVLVLLLVAGFIAVAGGAARKAPEHIKSPPRTEATISTADATTPKSVVNHTPQRRCTTRLDDSNISSEMTLVPWTPAKKFSEAGTQSLPQSSSPPSLKPASTQTSIKMASHSTQTRILTTVRGIQTRAPAGTFVRASTQTLNHASTSIAIQTDPPVKVTSVSTQTKRVFHPCYSTCGTQTDIHPLPVTKVYAEASVQALNPLLRTSSRYAKKTEAQSGSSTLRSNASRTKTDPSTPADNATLLSTTLASTKLSPSSPTVFGITTPEGIIPKSSAPRSVLRGIDGLASLCKKSVIDRKACPPTTGGSSRPFISANPGMTTSQEIDFDFNALWQAAGARASEYDVISRSAQPLEPRLPLEASSYRVEIPTANAPEPESVGTLIPSQSQLDVPRLFFDLGKVPPPPLPPCSPLTNKDLARRSQPEKPRLYARTATEKKRALGLKLKDETRQEETRKWLEQSRLWKETRERLTAKNGCLEEEVKSLRQDNAHLRSQVDDEKQARETIEESEKAKQALWDEERAHLEAELSRKVKETKLLQKNVEDLQGHEVESVQEIVTELAHVHEQLWAEQQKSQKEKALARTARLQEKKVREKLEEESQRLKEESWTRAQISVRLSHLEEENKRLQQDTESYKKEMETVLGDAQTQLRKEEEARQVQTDEFQTRAAEFRVKETKHTQERSNIEEKLKKIQNECDEHNDKVTELTSVNISLQVEIINLLNLAKKRALEMDESLNKSEDDLLFAVSRIAIECQRRIKAEKEAQDGAVALREEKEKYNQERADQEQRFKVAVDEQREENQRLNQKIAEVQEERAQKLVEAEKELDLACLQLEEEKTLRVQAEENSQAVTTNLQEKEKHIQELVGQEQRLLTELDENIQQKAHLLTQVEEKQQKIEEIRAVAAQELTKVETEFALVRIQLEEEKLLRIGEERRYQETTAKLQEEIKIHVQELAEQEQRFLAELDQCEKHLLELAGENQKLCQQEICIIQQREENQRLNQKIAEVQEEGAQKLVEAEKELDLAYLELEEEKRLRVQAEENSQAVTTNLQEKEKHIQELVGQEQRLLTEIDENIQQKARILTQVEEKQQKIEEIRAVAAQALTKVETEFALVRIQLEEEKILRTGEESRYQETTAKLREEIKIHVQGFAEQEQRFLAELGQCEAHLSKLMGENQKLCQQIREIREEGIQMLGMAKELEEEKKLRIREEEIGAKNVMKILKLETELASARVRLEEEKEIREQEEQKSLEMATRLQEENQTRTRELKEQEQTLLVELDKNKEQIASFLRLGEENRQLCQTLKEGQEVGEQKLLDAEKELALARVRLGEETWLRAQEEKRLQDSITTLQKEGEIRVRDFDEQERKLLVELNEQKERNAGLLERAEENQQLRRQLEELRGEWVQQISEMENKITSVQTQLLEESELRFHDNNEASTQIAALHELEARRAAEHTLHEQQLQEERKERGRLEDLINFHNEETRRLAEHVERLKEELAQKERELAMVREQVEREEQQRLWETENKTQPSEPRDDEAKEEPHNSGPAQSVTDESKGMGSTDLPSGPSQETEAETRPAHPRAQEPPLSSTELIPTKVPIQPKTPEKVQSPTHPRRLNLPGLFKKQIPSPPRASTSQEIEPRKLLRRKQPLSIVSEAASDFASMLKGVRSGLKPVSHPNDPTRRSIPSTTSGLGNTIVNAPDAEVQIAQFKSRAKLKKNNVNTSDAAPPS